jgi:hypothetical protein
MKWRLGLDSVGDGRLLSLAKVGQQRCSHHNRALQKRLDMSLAEITGSS